jgi:hypothetical protein
VSHAQEYDALASVQIAVHVLAPAGLRSIVTEAIPPPSVAVAATVTVPVSGEPGSVTATMGTTLSMRMPVRVVDAVVFPAWSRATARSS